MSGGDSTRKPSGSSSHSGGHSPTTVHPHRKITPTSTANMHNVNVTAANSLKAMNPSWEVWGSGSPSASKTTHDLSPVYPESNWASSRPNSGNWEDVNVNAHAKDMAQLDAQATSKLHSGRQRQGQNVPYSGQRSDNRSKGGRFDSTLDSPRYGGAALKSLSANPYSSMPANQGGAAGYDSLSGSANVDDLSLAFRGMAVEDDLNSQHQNAVSQPPRAAYGNFAQDQSSYYANSGTDYSYGYDMYRRPMDVAAYVSPVMASAVPTSVYSAQSMPMSAGMAGSQFYYPSQAMMYTSLNAQPQGSSAIPGGKKRETSAAAFGVDRMPTPSHHGYHGSLDYSQRLPMMVSSNGMMYGQNPPAIHMFPQSVRSGRRDGSDHPSFALRSALLDEFRANKSRRWELKDIFGYIVEFSGDQHGSRFIQQKLENATADELQTVFDEIVPGSALQLTQDVFGNYVVQKLFEYGNPTQRSLLAATMEGHILPLSLQMYGCRVVQKAIECISPEHQELFVKELETYVLKCVKDANGNHVIQKVVECIPAERLAFVDAFRGNVYDLASHPYGCRVLQRCLEHLPLQRTRPLLDELHERTLELMQDQFGNYVVQFILERGEPEDRLLVLNALRGQMLMMAKHKFASNVCEKALVCADSESRYAMIEEIMLPKDAQTSPVVLMMKDQFANYVLQRAMAVVEPPQREPFLNQIRSQLVALRRFSNPYTKHLISVERMLDKCSNATLQPVS